MVRALPEAGFSDLVLPDEFWADFAAHNWEQKPLVLKRPFTRLFAAPDELLDAARTASRAFLDAKSRRHASQVARVRIFVDGAGLFSDLEDFLPDVSDPDIEQFFARMATKLGDRRFEFIAHELQEFSPPLWHRIRRFLRGLYRHVGLPAQRAETVAFLRTHERTSFGMHRDDAGVFVFVLVGHKRILTWPESSMSGREQFLSTTKYGQFRDEAIVLEGEPGDVLYWPSSHWHVGETDGTPSVTLHVLLHLWPAAMDGLRQLSQLAQRRVADAIGPTWPLEVDDLKASAKAVPEALREALNAARQLCDGPELERYVAFAWLKRVTASGFTRVPTLAPHRQLSDHNTVRAVADEPIVCIPFGDDRVACSAAGHAMVAPASAELSRLLARLSQGRCEQVGALLAAVLKDGAGAGERAVSLREILEKLMHFGAIVCIS